MTRINQNLSQKQLQRLSPNQIQLLKLFQIPTASIEQRIKEELEANPALEDASMSSESADDSTEYEDTPMGFDEDTDRTDSEESDGLEVERDDLTDFAMDYDDDDVASYKLKDNNNSSEDEGRILPAVVERSFMEFLTEQLGMLDLDGYQHAIALQIIGNIDDDGYLRRDLNAIVDELEYMAEIKTTHEHVQAVLSQIQTFDPPGVGARGLQECLLLQLRRKEQSGYHHQHPAVLTAIRVLEKCFEDFSNKRFERIQKQLNISEAELRAATEEVQRLNPKPGSAFAPSSQVSQNYTIPDFIIVNRNGELELTLNSRNAPDLRVSDYYRDMLREYAAHGSADRKQREAVQFIKQKIDAAKWFVDAIKQRHDTLYRTMQTIMDLQKSYFLSGDEKQLRPMILKDVAERTKLDVSTVSRVVGSKYVQTEFGTKLLKDFFSESVTTEAGEEVSTREVKKILSELIEGEDKKNPYSDEQLCDLLSKGGYKLARRTVAKYREQLNFPVARLRREL